MNLIKIFLTIALGVLPAISWGSTANVRTSPLGLLAGALVIEADFPIDTHWTAGPTLFSYRFKVDDTSITGTSFGGRANWHKNGIFTDGLYASPQLSFVSASAELGSSSASVTATVLSGTVGYGWFWPEGFNMLLGGGLSLPIGTAKLKLNGEEYDAYAGGAGIGLEWTAGWIF